MILQESPRPFELRSDAFVSFLTALVDCCGRLARAAEDLPHLTRA